MIIFHAARVVTLAKCDGPGWYWHDQDGTTGQHDELHAAVKQARALALKKPEPKPEGK